MSATAKYSSDPGAILLRGLILSEAGTPRAASEDIMALALRMVLWVVVLLAPGGLLLLPFLALHEIKGTQKSGTADAH